MTQLGLLGGISAIATIIFSYLGGMLSDKFGERVGIVFGNILIGSAILVMLNVTEFVYFIGAWVLLGVGQALNGPAYSSLISKAVPEKMRGTAFGFLSSSIGILSLPSPYIGTLVWQSYGPKVPFYILLVAMILMLPVIWIKFKHPGNGKTSPDQVAIEQGSVSPVQKGDPE